MRILVKVLSKVGDWKSLKFRRPDEKGSFIRVHADKYICFPY